MSIADQINEDIKSAMKAQDKDRLSALRDIKAKLLLEMTKEGGTGQVEESIALKILDKLYKQRMESAAIYKEQARQNLYDEEMAQAAVIKSYLPEALSQQELQNGITEIIAETGATSIADLGKVMAIASKRFAGRADGKVISELVRSLLVPK